MPESAFDLLWKMTSWEQAWKPGDSMSQSFNIHSNEKSIHWFWVEKGVNMDQKHTKK
jgi:hypothetical protein